MEDRLLFRAWLKDDKIMRDVFSFDCNHVILWNRDGEEYIIPPDTRDCVLMQCTGLKDKNGKLIFDGDIYKFINPDGEYETEIIQLKEHNMETQYGEIFIGFIVCGYGKGEIIGNIYDNPELLN